MNPQPARETNVRDHYDPDEFRKLGHELVDRLGGYLERALAGRDLPVLPGTSPQEMKQAINPSFPTQPGGNLIDSLLDVVERANHLHHPRYMGHQVSPVLPAASLAELTRSLLNGSTSIFEMGPVHTIMEQHVVRFLAQQIGYGPGAGGILTHGGSVGNLTALLAMRQLTAAGDVWGDGQNQRYAILASGQGHYCVQRAVQMMGWGRDGVSVVDVDREFRMKPECLAQAKAKAESQGRTVLAVAANACSTATGSFDPLNAIADFCAEHKLWFHVDGAHGASYLLSPTNRSLLEGIARADSVVWDLHKMLLLPSLITAVVYRNGQHSQAAFSQEASYVFRAGDLERESFDIGSRTIECTKGGLGVTAYATLQAVGTDALASYLDRSVELTRAFADVVEQSTDFELAVRPMCNIVCFRRTSGATGDLDALQERIRQHVVASGEFYVVMASLNGAKYLRLTLVNPFTELDDLQELLRQLCAVA